MKVPCARMTINYQNANRKYKLVLMDGSGDIHWLMRIRFVNKDRSIYLIPILKEPGVIKFFNNPEIDDIEYVPDGDIHLSIHKSKAVKLTVLGSKLWLRHPIDPDKHIEKLCTLGFSDISQLISCSSEEFNNPKSKTVHIPVIGFTRICPVFVTIYCVNSDEEWEDPVTGDLSNVGYRLRFPKTGYEFYIHVWQHTQMNKFDGLVNIEWHE